MATMKKMDIATFEEAFKNESMQQPLTICKDGHSYHKTSDCPSCPVCEKNDKPSSGFLATI